LFLLWKSEMFRRIAFIAAWDAIPGTSTASF